MIVIVYISNEYLMVDALVAISTASCKAIYDCVEKTKDNGGRIWLAFRINKAVYTVGQGQ